MRSVCFVTGTRAEFGLMRRVLQAIREHPDLQLQILVTGMHLDERFGRSIDLIREEGWRIDAVVEWAASHHTALGTVKGAELAVQTGQAMAEIATRLQQMRSEVVLVVGDRVEAFAAAAAGHLSGRVVAHVHGGDRAMGQVDDSLRHAITKLSHVHFPATAQSARRLRRLGEEDWRIHLVGSPGIDGIISEAEEVDWSAAGHAGEPWTPLSYALVLLHPVEADERREYERAGGVLSGVRGGGIERVVLIYPNNDPGCGGIIRCWEERKGEPGLMVLRNAPRGQFLGLMRQAAVLVGNSSSGVIEAASFGTRVIDIGERQLGRERSGNVMHVPYDPQRITAAVGSVWNGGRVCRWRGRNVYGGGTTARQIAQILARQDLVTNVPPKLIRY